MAEAAVDLVPELGDSVTFVSRVFTRTTGKIVYRDGSTIRIQEYNGNTQPVTFELNPANGYFLERYGVTEIVIHKKRTDAHFAVQLGTLPGEHLEFYDLKGDPIAAGKVFIVEEILATEEVDAIRLAGNIILDFGFLGTPDGIGLIIPHPPPEEEPELVTNEGIPIEVAEEVEPFPGFDAIALPAALVEEIPTEERMYSDSIQRADMFTSLYSDVAPKRQKDPRILADLYRRSDLLLALKNSVVMRDEGGAVVIGQTRSYIANTLQDALAKTNEPLAAAMPVAAVKKVVYVDEDVGGERKDVEVRLDEKSLLASAAVHAGTEPAGVGGNAFLQMMHSLLQTQEAFVPSEAGEKRIVVDQDVLRSAMPFESVEGFPFAAVPALERKKKDEEEVPLRSSFLGAIDERVVRLIGPSRIKNNRTGAVYTVAPADTAAAFGHVVLPRDLVVRRAPTRSSVLLWDCLASEVGRRMTNTFYAALKEQIGNAEFVYGDRATADELADLPLADQITARLEGFEGATQFMNRESIMTLDAFGLRNLELTNELLDPLKKAIRTGQEAWGAAYARLKTAALGAAKAGGTPAVRGIVDETSPLMSAETMGDDTMLPVVQTIRERESLLKMYDLVYANDLTKQASATLGPYWFALAASAAEDAVARARDVFLHEAARLDNIVSVRRQKSAEFTTKPQINPCPHVHDLEKIYAIRDDSKRMVMLDKFIKRNQAGQRGNYILCSSCGENLVCRHEVLMIQEFMNPGRSTALHKALLLEFGNGVFEGSYICKNCGQKLREIEYDTHLEFDENGKPLVGRAVIEADPEEGDFAINLADDTDAPFKEKTDVAIYKIARTIFEAMGYNAPVEVYQRVVPAAKQYIAERIQPEDPYNAMRERAKGLKGAQVPPEYKAYFANQQIGILAALAVLELQTMVDEIPVPHAGITYSREGFPLDPVFSRDNLAAVQYVTFCVASQLIDSQPWNETSWSGQSQSRIRLGETQNALLSTLFNVLALAPPSAPGKPPNKAPAPLGEVTASYTDRLASAREARAAANGGAVAARALASRADQLPPSFRPLTFHEMPKEGYGGQVAIGNVERFRANIAGGDVSKVAPAVAARSHILTQGVMADFHTQAKTGAILSRGSPYSFSSCCHRRLGAVAITGMGVRGLELPESRVQEIEIVGAASREVKLADPVASAAGTHLYMPWNAPRLETVLPTPQPDDYYKLFLKNCFQGRAYGLPHEFGSADGVCRNCGFELPEALRSPLGVDLPLNMGDKAREKRMEELRGEAAEAARGAIAAAGVVISEDSFLKLEAAIRARRQVPPIIRPVDMPFLMRLAAIFAQPASLDAVLPGARDHAVALLTGLQEIHDEGLDARTDEGRVARFTALGPFTMEYDRMLVGLEGIMTGLASREVARDVRPALDAMRTLTANATGAVGARNILAALVLTGEQIANDYPNDTPRASKWFPKIARSHTATLEKIWARAAEVATGGITALKAERSDTVAAGVRSILHKFTTWLAPWLHIWISEFRVDNLAITGEELTTILRWLVVTGMTALLTTSSPLFAEIDGAEAKKAIARFLNVWLIDTLVKNGVSVSTYQLTRKQIEEQLQIRAEKEEAYFIDKFDKLDRDMRQVELMKKRLKIGDWAVGTTKNLFRYDADFFEFERDQRAAMGVPDFEESVTGVGGGAAEQGGDRYGLGRVGGGEEVNVHQNDHYAETGEEY